MIGIEEFIERGEINKPLLFLGKGPSFDMKDKFLLSNFFTIAANHAIRSVKADVCSVIDIDVLRDCSDQIYNNCQYLMMPWYPHDPEMGYSVSEKNLQELAKDHSVIQKMIDEDRLIFYNLSSSTNYNNQSRVYATAINSADTLFNMLVSNGIDLMYSLGVDGGTEYSKHFSDLTPLRNMRDSFDEQDPVIESICYRSGAEFIRLQDQQDLQVFVGSAPEQLIPSLVLDYSIKKHTMSPSVVTPLYTCPVGHRTPKDPNCRPRTPFSFQRFFIPSLTEGIAFYMDSDMQVFKDLAELHQYVFEGYDGLSAAGMEKFDKWPDSNFAMLMLDCDNIQWDVNSIIDMLDEGKMTYRELMFEFKHARINSSLGHSGIWNSLDHYEEGETALLHYTDMATQPWKYAKHPLGYLWENDLKEAISCGFIDKELYETHVSKGHIREIL